MSSIQWLLFDIGGVLIEIEQARIFDELAKHSGLPADAVRSTLLQQSHFWDPFIENEYLPHQVTHEVNSALGTRLTEEQVVTAFNAELGAAIRSTTDLIPDVRRRTKVGCLSNTNSIHWDYMLRTYDFMGQFDRRFASQILGSAKPSPIIYERVQEHLVVAPRQILFFDDREENVEAACSKGWNARLYRNHEGLIADLREFKLA